MTAVIFPGQGAQYVGMGQSFYQADPQAKNIFDSLDKILGFDLSKKCFQGPAEELKSTAVQQVAILAVSLAGFEVFKKKGIKPDYLSGLSLGEYSCLYAGGVLSLEDTALLVRQRAQSMEKSAQANPSTMFAVLGAEADLLKDKAKERGFYIANLNAPGQVVISLAKDKSPELKGQLETEGFRVIELAVSGGFHSLFMEPARSELAKVIEAMDFSGAKIPIVSNFTARAHQKPQEIKDNLLKQLVSPVLWEQGIKFMAASGVDSFFEIGPSKVLRGLLRKINSDLKVTNIEKAEDLNDL